MVCSPGGFSEPVGCRDTTTPRYRRLTQKIQGLFDLTGCARRGTVIGWSVTRACSGHSPYWQRVSPRSCSYFASLWCPFALPGVLQKRARCPRPPILRRPDAITARRARALLRRLAPSTQLDSALQRTTCLLRCGRNRPLRFLPGVWSRRPNAFSLPTFHRLPGFLRVCGLGRMVPCNFLQAPSAFLLHFLFVSDSFLSFS